MSIQIMTARQFESCRRPSGAEIRFVSEVRGLTPSARCPCPFGANMLDRNRDEPMVAAMRTFPRAPETLCL